jgi:hypothetical protein
VVSTSDPRFPNDFYVNAAAQQVVSLPPHAAPQSTAGPGNDFLTRQGRPARDGDLVTLYGPDGAAKCTVTSPVNPGSTSLPDRRQQDLSYVSLRDGFVLHDFGRYKDPTNLSGAREPSALRMFNNTACQETAQVPISAFLGLLAAPGVVLALRQDMSNLRTVLVEGYY